MKNLNKFILVGLVLLCGCSQTKVYIYSNPEGIDCNIKKGKIVSINENPKVIFISNKPLEANIENKEIKSSINNKKTKDTDMLNMMKNILPLAILK